MKEKGPPDLELKAPQFRCSLLIVAQAELALETRESSSEASKGPLVAVTSLHA